MDLEQGRLIDLMTASRVEIEDLRQRITDHPVQPQLILVQPSVGVGFSESKGYERSIHEALFKPGRGVIRPIIMERSSVWNDLAKQIICAQIGPVYGIKTGEQDPTPIWLGKPGEEIWERYTLLLDIVDAKVLEVGGAMMEFKEVDLSNGKQRKEFDRTREEKHKSELLAEMYTKRLVTNGSASYVAWELSVRGFEVSLSSLSVPHNRVEVTRYH